MLPAARLIRTSASRSHRPRHAFDMMQFMKLGRLIFATAILVSMAFALQGGFQGYGRRQQYYEPGPNVPSEFYWSRLRYNAAYQDNSVYGWRRFGGGWSRDYPKADNDCLIALRRLDPHQLALAPECSRSR